ncbi:MAG TPA: hypothetical protein VFP35_01570 [Candidatus Saccharimonadales bacterium]|nr:hypothetical protein [Candidatus Saccharimonadales bacterium]
MDSTSRQEPQAPRGGRAGRFWSGIGIIIILIIIALIIWWLVAGNNNNTNGNNQNSVSSTAQKQNKIRANWVKFFNGATPAQQKVALLQNGQQFSQVIDAQAQSPAAKATTATVSSVAINTPSSATVTYTIYQNKQAVLSKQTGQAVLQNGTWKVSDGAFCNLLGLSGQVPPNCPGGSSSGASGSQSGGTSGSTQGTGQTGGGTGTGTTQ